MGESFAMLYLTIKQTVEFKRYIFYSPTNETDPFKLYPSNWTRNLYLPSLSQTGNKLARIFRDTLKQLAKKEILATFTFCRKWKKETLTMNAGE